MRRRNWVKSASGNLRVQGPWKEASPDPGHPGQWSHKPQGIEPGIPFPPSQEYPENDARKRKLLFLFSKRNFPLGSNSSDPLAPKDPILSGAGPRRHGSRRSPQKNYGGRHGHQLRRIRRVLLIARAIPRLTVCSPPMRTEFPRPQHFFGID
jgi:hypothetical protein